MKTTSVPALPNVRNLLSPQEELQLAGMIGTSFQSSIQHADSKGGMVMVAYFGIITMMVSQSDRILAVAGITPAGATLTVIMLLGFVGAGVFTGLSLTRAIRPRITPPSRSNVFAFPAVAASDGLTVRGSSMEQLCADAWALNRLLAGIAAEKHRHVARAISGSTALAVMMFLAMAMMAVIR